jgi:hypothetical protein
MTERSITATIYPLANLAEQEHLDRPLASWLPSLEQSQGVLVIMLDLAELPMGGFSFMPACACRCRIGPGT